MLSLAANKLSIAEAPLADDAVMDGGPTQTSTSERERWSPVVGVTTLACHACGWMPELVAETAKV